MRCSIAQGSDTIRGALSCWLGVVPHLNDMQLLGMLQPSIRGATSKL